MNLAKTKRFLLLIFLLLSVLPMSQAVVAVQTAEANPTKLTKASFEKHLGRKLTFSEKIAFKIFNKKIKKFDRAKKQQRKTQADDCGKIVLKNGKILDAKVIQIASTKVSYKPCNNTDDPEILIDKKEVFSIQNSEGEVLYLSSDSPEELNTTAMEAENQQTHNLAIASLILVIFSVFLSIGASPLAFLLGALAVIFGAISKSKIKRNPMRYKGKKMASTGIVLGVLICAILMIPLLLFISQFQ